MAINEWMVLTTGAFFVLVVLACWQKPPMTRRGRVFYLLTGITGLLCGYYWLTWMAVACGFAEKPHPRSTPRPLTAVLREMFAVDGGLLSVLVDLAMIVVGLRYLLKGVFARPYQEGTSDEGGSHRVTADGVDELRN